MRACLIITCALLLTTAWAARDTAAQSARRARVVTAGADDALTGVYRLNLDESDKLYTVVAGASSNLPFAEQQRFFLDLAVRLAPPDLLAFERRGRRVQLASSRAPRITFDADGGAHTERGNTGQTVRTRATLSGQRLTVTTGEGDGDRFTVVFEPTQKGRQLLVTRYISAPQLTQPVVVHSVYDKISDVARWEIYGEPERTPPTDITAVTGSGTNAAAHDAVNAARTTTPRAVANLAERDEAARLRRALEDWIAATNARDIERQMTYYLPTLTAYYLKRGVPRADVRAEKARVFARARTIDIRAADPEILFADGGRTAVMRFRKAYVIAGGGADRRGEVVQELRWQRTPAGWRITSERDVRVLR